MSLHEIPVSHRGDDPIGRDVLAEAQRTLGIDGLDEVKTAKIYRLEGLDVDQSIEFAEGVLRDPVSERYSLDTPIDFDTPHVVEVAFKPGVMNKEAGSMMKAASDMGFHPEAASSSTQYAFYGRIAANDVDHIVERLLVNKTVEEVVTKNPQTLKFEGEPGPVNIVPIREASTATLADLSKDKLFLNDEEMSAIQGYFRGLDRDPTDCELEVIAASSSEHCGHKTFKAPVFVDGVEKAPLYERIKRKAKVHFKGLVKSAFGDNSGVMEFYDGQAICGKVETHNSPSAIEPYGGAMTGSGGVFRDIMGTGQGAKTILSTDMFCLADPNLEDAKLPPGTLRPDYLQRRVVQGVRDYGNPMGIPTPNGSFHYHEDFRAKPTVIVGAYGILPEARAQKGIPQLGDRVVAVGGRTGRDGIHGATFSSGEMTERTANVNSSAVQIGNPIEEKRMFDALLEARDLGLIRAITDCGAAGFSSAIGEMGEDTGVTVDISLAPLKYPGLAPWEIWLSESQERMVAAISPEDLPEFMEVCKKYNVEATDLGFFDDSNTLTVNYGEQNIVDLDYDFLKYGMPQRTMVAHYEREVFPEVRPEAPQDEREWIDRLKAVLGHGNVCSKEPVVRQYDQGVQGGSIVPAFGGEDQNGPNDAAVIRPILGKPYGMVQSHGMNPILNRIDPYYGTMWAVAEAGANYVAVGGNIDEAVSAGNYICPFPDEESMGSLDQMVDGAVHMMDVLEVPVITGKDSLSSTYRGKDGEVIKIPPVYCASIFGRIPDVEKTVTSDIKKPGESLLVLVGKPDSGMAGSAYYDVTGGSSNQIPMIDLNNLRDIFRELHTRIEQGRILSCHDVSEGGLITTISEMCFGGNSGVDIQLPTNIDPESLLFSETAGCFVIEIEEYDENSAMFAGLPHTIIGRTTPEPQITVRQRDQLFTTGTDELKEAWQKPMKELFHA